MNLILYTSVLKVIIDDIIESAKAVEQRDIINNYKGPPEAKSSELRAIIEWAVLKNYLQRKLKNPRDTSLISISSNDVIELFKNDIDIVISIPVHTELGLGRVKMRNKMIETRDAFYQVITSAQSELRISSPFLQENILMKEGLPDLKEIFIKLFENGCRISILSRELYARRGPEVSWLKKLADKNGHSELLHIYDYHHEATKKKVISSTHSKMIIADVSMAYVGSGELRKNSLSNNFEVGCLIRGPIVAGLCEAFDLMVKYSKEWEYENW